MTATTIFNLYIANNFHCTATGITKFDVFQYFICDNLGYVFQIQKSNMAAGRHLVFLKLRITSITHNYYFS